MKGHPGGWPHKSGFRLKLPQSLNVFSRKEENAQPNYRDPSHNGHCIHITAKLQPFHRKAFFGI